MRIAIANEKGGCGKTTTAVNLAACLGALGRRVLLVDLDPQSNATTHAGHDLDRTNEHLLQVFTGERELETIIVPDVFPNVSLVPSSPMLAAAPAQLAQRRVGADRVLRKALQALRPAWEYVIVDCQPSLGILTINALAAVEYVIVPVEPAAFSLDGLAEMQETILEVREDLNPDLQLLGVLVCRAEMNTRMYRSAMHNLEEAMRGKVFATRIPRNTRIAEAAGAGQPVMLYDPSSAGTLSYRKLAQEVEAYRA